VEHSAVSASPAELIFTTPAEFSLGMRPDDLNQAIRRIVDRPMKIRIVEGQGTGPAAAPKRAPQSEDEITARALAHPEVKRFQEAFPEGKIRTVRNLKE